MRKIRFPAVVMAIVMLMPALMSCRSVKTSENVVKEDDPWYETTRFKLDKDIKKYETLGDTGVCSSDDRLFSIYPLTKDMWGSNRTVLDTYDLSGNLLERKELSCPDGFRVQSIYDASSDPEGKTIYAGVYLNSSGKRFQAFIDIDTETGAVSNIKDIFEKGNTFVNDVWDIDIVGVYAVVTCDDSSGSPEFSYSMKLFKNSELVGELDMSAVHINYFYEGVSIDQSMDSLYVAGLENGEVLIMEFDLNNGKLKDKKRPGDLDDKKANIAEYSATGNGDLCKLDSAGNIIKADINTMAPETVIDATWYTPFCNPLLTEGTFTTKGILSCTDKRTVILDTVTKSYGMFDSKEYEYITVLEKADKNPHAGKQIIEIALGFAFTGVSDYLSKAIYEYNRADNPYLLKVWDKHKTGYTIGKGFSGSGSDEYSLIEDVKGSEGPDIVINVPNRLVMQDEVLMDLTGFLDPEVMEKQYGNIIEAGRTGGKLDFLPVILEIEGLVTNTDLIEDGASGVTFEEYDRMVKEDLNGFSPYDYPLSFEYNKSSFVKSCIDTRRAVSGDTIDFGTDQFRSAVEYAKDNFPYDDEFSCPDDYAFDYIHRQKTECCYSVISNYLEFVIACNKQKEHYVIIGTPSIDASGPRFNAVETVSVLANTDVKEGCRDFINFLFSGNAFDSCECDFRNIVTNREIMSRNIESLTEYNNESYDKYLASKDSGAIRVELSVERAYGNKYATDDMKESFLNSMSTISNCYYEDHEINVFIREETAPYYAGDRSLDDVIKILNDRTSKYIGEI